MQNPIQYFIDCIRRGRPPGGPLSTEICCVGQQIVDAAVLSSQLGRMVSLDASAGSGRMKQGAQR